MTTERCIEYRDVATGKFHKLPTVDQIGSLVFHDLPMPYTFQVRIGRRTWHELQFIPLRFTQRHADAFVAYADLIADATTVNRKLLAMMVKPTDVGLTKRMGGECNPKWAAVYVVLEDGVIIFNACIYHIIVEDGPYCFSTIANTGTPVNNAKLCHWWYDWMLQPKIGVLVEDVDDIEDGTALMQVNYDQVPLWRSEVSIESPVRLLYNFEIALRDRERVRRSLVASKHKFFMSEPEACLTAGGEFKPRPDAVRRMPHIVLKYVEFYLAVPDLPPYVVLWIFDNLLYFDMHAEHLKIRWLQQIYHSVRLLRLRRHERPVTRSAKRRLEGAPTDTNKR